MGDYSAAVVGATGYTGVELIGILADHPHFTVTVATARDDAGALLSALYPALLETDADIALAPLDTFDPGTVDVVFLAVPHTTAMHLAPGILDGGARVIDLSADFRLRDRALYEQYYGVGHSAASLLDEAVYALPELVEHHKIAGARLLACPGCYPTATALAAAPLYRCGLAEPGESLIVDAKSGVSGAGRKASLAMQYCAVDESVGAYKVAAHQHTPEIEQTLSALADAAVAVTFVPHLVAMKRGILATVYASLAATSPASPADARQVHDAFATTYAHEPFVTVLPLGQQPKTSSVTGTNQAQIGVAVDERSSRAIITCAIDNLGKGAASQAVQVANIAYGLDQSCGLETFRTII
jgi:N-acetyl-gamma-glutamyl-phosphate reductase